MAATSQSQLLDELSTRFSVDTRKFVMTMSTDDQGKAAAAIKLAQQLQRPLLIKKLIPEVATKFNIEQLLGVDELKVYPDDAGLGIQPVRDWLTLPRRYQRGRTDSEKITWGGLATIMSEKARQKPQLERFMSEGFAWLRDASGFTGLSQLGGLVWGQEASPRSRNFILTGAEVKGRVNKSDAHQDQHDNLMLVCSGSKIWALADLTEEQVKLGKKNGNKTTLKASLGIDAVDASRNTCEAHHEVARMFDRVYMGPGDVLYNPAYVWHQVNSEPMTLAYSIMYGIPGGETEEEEGEGCEGEGLEEGEEERPEEEGGQQVEEERPIGRRMAKTRK